MACATAAAGPPTDELLTPEPPDDSAASLPLPLPLPLPAAEPSGVPEPEDADADAETRSGSAESLPVAASELDDVPSPAPQKSPGSPEAPEAPEPETEAPKPEESPPSDPQIADDSEKTNHEVESSSTTENGIDPDSQVAAEENKERSTTAETVIDTVEDIKKNDEDACRESEDKTQNESRSNEKIVKPTLEKMENKTGPSDESFVNRDECVSLSEENMSSKDENCLSGESENESNHVIEETNKKKNNAMKRGFSDNTSDQCPSKKLCQELQDTFPKHDLLLSDYISNISCSTEEEIHKQTENLIGEIEMLRELANTKEVEWNQLIHLRKVKEEILLRLFRKRNMMSAEKVFCNLPDLSKELSNKQIFELNKTCVDDKNDEVQRLKTKNLSSASGNAVQLNSSGLMMVPVSSSVYCQSNMNNSNFDNHVNPHLYNKQNILPKPVMIPNHRLSSFHLPELNGQSNRYTSPKGRQGAVKDVQSIIADHRQRYPDAVPRRGRRMKSVLNPQMSNTRLPIPHSDHNAADLGLLFGNLDATQHLSPVDAMSLQQSQVLNQAGLPNGMSFKDVLVRFANITGDQQSNCINTKLHPPPPYPDVTLHPVGGNAGVSPFTSKISQQQQQQQTNSLLHGILTKSQPRQDNRFSTFSPTLAQLLTAPEKNTPANVSRSINSINAANNYVQQKTSSEITITAVQPTVSNTSINQNQAEILQLDEFDETEPEEDSADRPLVIDEGGRDNSNNKDMGNNALELNENEVPECQGCRKREAQFVCAGCANQWYCSRECQVSAWDEHSEVCTG